MIVEGWAIVDKNNPTGAYVPHRVIGKVSHVFGSPDDAEAHLSTLKCMPEFLHKDWEVTPVVLLIGYVRDALAKAKEEATE